jgi:hypothetical protein
MTRDQQTGNWIIVASADNNLSQHYNTILPPETLSCSRGWVEGVAVLDYVDLSTSSSNSSSSETSQSSNSSLSSDSSTLRNLYNQYFGNCDGPECTSEYYCYYEVVEEWVCESVSDSDFESSQSSASSASSESQSNSDNVVTTCSSTIAIIFG